MSISSGSNQRFTAYLRSGASIVASSQTAQEDVVQGVSSRIREGRTDAASERYNAREDRAQAAQRRPEAEDALQRSVEEGGSASPTRAARAERDADPRPQTRRKNRGEHARPDAAPEGHSSGPASGPELSGRERATGWTDASDARGAPSDDEPDAVPLAPFGAAAPPPAPVAAPTAAARIAQVAAAQAVGSPLGASAVSAARGAATPIAPIAQQPATELPQAARAKSAAPTHQPGSTERAEAILDQLRLRIQSGEREATIHLRPAELGQLRMHIKVESGAVHATIAAESAETLAVLEAHGPELRSWLAREGRESVSLEFALLDQRQHGSDQAQQRQQNRKSGREGRQAQRAAALTNSAPEALVRALASRSADRGVDLVA